MKATIDYLSDKELELYNTAESLDGTMNGRISQLPRMVFLIDMERSIKAILICFFTLKIAKQNLKF